MEQNKSRNIFIRGEINEKLFSKFQEDFISIIEEDNNNEKHIKILRENQ